jgi:CubicO group peptidase (beta-lactamase class C family)
MLVGRVLRERFPTAEAYLQFVFSQLINKLGMQHTFLETDWRGDLVISSQVWTTARDLARLGILHLQNGQWQGEQILPPHWLAYISTPAPAQPPRANNAGQPSPGYGAQWWLFDQGFPELPGDTIAARGNRGQYLFVIPSRQLVIVRRGYDLAGEPPFREHEFAADVLRALNSVAQP